MNTDVDFFRNKLLAIIKDHSGDKNHGFLVYTGSKSLNKASANSIFFCSYDYKNKIENLESRKSSSLKFDDIVFFEATEEQSIENFPETKFTKQNNPITLSAKTSKEEYIKNVEKLKVHIQNGDIYEINYCITFEAKNAVINPLEIYSKLNAISKAPYSALVKLNDKYIISASPELFLSKRGNKLFTKPIKGTIKRGTTAEEDEKLKSELFNSIKERTENVMIVDVARNDLSRIAKKGTVKVEKLYDIESYEQVHQMVSTVSCELKENISFDDIIKATFPMASMTGAPKIRAMELIDDFETNSRGPYSGCIGYIKENGDFDLSVLIRSIFYNETESYLSFSVGSAITAMCNPEKEYEECLLKAAALKKVLEG
jgi:para-aminobenzoate synthetase component 1